MNFKKVVFLCPPPYLHICIYRYILWCCSCPGPYRPTWTCFVCCWSFLPLNLVAGAQRDFGLTTRTPRRLGMSTRMRLLAPQRRQQRQITVSTHSDETQQVGVVWGWVRVWVWAWAWGKALRSYKKLRSSLFLFRFLFSIFFVGNLFAYVTGEAEGRVWGVAAAAECVTKWLLRLLLVV